MGSSPISGTREPHSISFSFTLLASFLAKRAPYWEPDSAQPRLFLSLLPRHLLEPHASGTLQCSSLSHSSSPTWPLRLLAPWCRPPRAPYEELHSDVSGTSSHLLFFLCASFCQTASPRSGASDFARPRSSVASSSPPPRAACISGTPALLQRSSRLLAPSSPCVHLRMLRLPGLRRGGLFSCL